MDIAKFLIGFLAGAAGGMGLGGGWILLLWLTAFSGGEQLSAQGINLVFFIPVGLSALFIHLKNGFIRKKTALLSIVSGIPGVMFGVFIAENMERNLLRGIFAVFLLVMGLRELFGKNKKEE